MDEEQWHQQQYEWEKKRRAERTVVEETNKQLKHTQCTRSTKMKQTNE